MLKQLLNVIGSYFSYFILLLICLIKYFFGDQTNSPAFKAIVIYILFLAIIHLILVLIIDGIIEKKYNKDTDKWIEQNKTRLPVKLLNIFIMAGVVSVIILWSCFHFYGIIYVFDWPWTGVYIAFIVLVTQLNGYFKRRKATRNPQISD